MMTRRAQYRLLWLLVLAWGAALAGACSGAQAGGESHFGTNRAFLRVCEDGRCESGDDCECGVCTVGCASVSDCALRILGPDGEASELPDNVVCRVPQCIAADSSGDTGETGDAGEGAVCEVTCSGDEDCAFLDEGHDGPDHVCHAGACRTDAEPVEPTEAVEVDSCPTGRLLIPGDLQEGFGSCLDRVEVTVEDYQQCVADGPCTEPGLGNIQTIGFSGHPINYITVEDAEAYCEFASGRLPTRDEWRAATSGASASPYPWGDQVPGASDDPALLCGPNETSTCEVGSFPDGSGSLGHLDLMGNVSEIVVDGDSVCVVGGAFDSDPAAFDIDDCEDVTDATASVGFRCANDL